MFKKFKLVKFAAIGIVGASSSYYGYSKSNFKQMKNYVSQRFVAFAKDEWWANNEEKLYSSKWDFEWDKSSKENTSGRRYIYLIRHGQYVHGKNREDKILTPLGRKQAVYVGRRLKEFGINFDSFVSSTMPRAKETANLLINYFPGRDIMYDHLLEEGFPCVPQPPNKRWLRALQPDEIENDPKRIEQAFKKYIRKPDTNKKTHEVIVCHGNVIRYFVCKALQIPEEAWLRYSVRHCSITILAVSGNGKVGVLSVGDSGFIPADKATFR